MATKYKDLSFAGKVRFWLLNIGIASAIGIVIYIIATDKPFTADVDAFGAKGSVSIGQSKK